MHYTWIFFQHASLACEDKDDSLVWFEINKCHSRNLEPPYLYQGELYLCRMLKLWTKRKKCNWKRENMSLNKNPEIEYNLVTRKDPITYLYPPTANSANTTHKDYYFLHKLTNGTNQRSLNIETKQPHKTTNNVHKQTPFTKITLQPLYNILTSVKNTVQNTTWPIIAK